MKLEQYTAVYVVYSMTATVKVQKFWLPSAKWTHSS